MCHSQPRVRLAASWSSVASFICTNIGASCRLGWRAMCLALTMSSHETSLQLEAVVGFTEAASKAKPHIFYLVPWAKAYHMAKPSLCGRGFLRVCDSLGGHYCNNLLYHCCWLTLFSGSICQCDSVLLLKECSV